MQSIVAWTHLCFNRRQTDWLSIFCSSEASQAAMHRARVTATFKCDVDFWCTLLSFLSGGQEKYRSSLIFNKGAVPKAKMNVTVKVPSPKHRLSNNYAALQHLYYYQNRKSLAFFTIYWDQDVSRGLSLYKLRLVTIENSIFVCTSFRKPSV